MADDRRFASGDLVPSIPWWRRLSDRVAALAIKARPPLYASWNRAGTRLDYVPRQSFAGIIKQETSSGFGSFYTVAEARFDPTSKLWGETESGRTVSAYEYNRQSGIPSGTVVEVHQSIVGDWRFWIPRGAPPPRAEIACTPCPMPVDADLTFYLREVHYVWNHVTNSPELCADDEYTVPMTWSPTSLSSAFKPGFYYTDCITRGLWNAGLAPCTYLGTSTFRHYLVCARETSTSNLLTLVSRVWGHEDNNEQPPPAGGDANDGAADCAAADPLVGSTFGGIFNWSSSTCSPFELRQQLYGTGTSVLDPVPGLIRDIWIYETP